MDSSSNELKELAELRASLGRVRNEIAVATRTEAALVEKLRARGVSTETGDAKILVAAIDPPDASERGAVTYPGRRLPRRESPQLMMLKAGVVGASLSIGLAIIVLLAFDLRRRSEARVASPSAGPVSPTPTVAAFATSSGPSVVSLAVRDLPPSTEPPTLASAIIPKTSPPPNAPTPPVTGTLTVVCVPKCDTITDNGVALSTSSPANLPVAPGPHKLVLTTATGIKRTIQTTVVPGQLREVHATMDTSAIYSPLPLPTASTSDRGF